jgi:hypothetical protein
MYHVIEQRGLFSYSWLCARHKNNGRVTEPVTKADYHQLAPYSSRHDATCCFITVSDSTFAMLETRPAPTTVWDMFTKYDCLGKAPERGGGGGIHAPSSNATSDPRTGPLPAFGFALTASHLWTKH